MHRSMQRMAKRTGRDNGVGRHDMGAEDVYTESVARPRRPDRGPTRLALTRAEHVLSDN